MNRSFVDPSLKGCTRSKELTVDNVLILDRERSSGFLIKSILLGRGCNVSISPTLKDARAKIHTGLFDALVLDVGEPQLEMPMIEEVQQLIPGFPVVALFREELRNGPFVALKKPVPRRLHVRRTSPGPRPFARRLEPPQHRRSRHDPDGRRIHGGPRLGPVRATGSSSPRNATSRPCAASMSSSTPASTANLTAASSSRRAKKTFHAKTAYVEHSPDSKVKHVGLIFDNDHEWFDRLVVAAPAADTATVSGTRAGLKRRRAAPGKRRFPGFHIDRSA